MKTLSHKWKLSHTPLFRDRVFSGNVNEHYSTLLFSLCCKNAVFIVLGSLSNQWNPVKPL